MHDQPEPGGARILPHKNPIVTVGFSEPEPPKEEQISILEVHLYDRFPHEFAPDYNLFAYLSGSIGDIHQFTGIRRCFYHCTFPGMNPENLSKSLTTLLAEHEIPFHYVGQRNSVHIYGFLRVIPNHITELIDSLI